MTHEKINAQDSSAELLQILEKLIFDLPELLTTDKFFSSVKFEKYLPTIHRLYNENYEGGQIHLNRIFPGDIADSGLHTHAAPLAVYILSGGYRMITSCDENEKGDERNEKLFDIILPAGSIYIMTSPRALHKLAPRDKESLSVCFFGNRFEKRPPIPFTHEKEVWQTMSDEEYQETKYLFLSALKRMYQARNFT